MGTPIHSPVRERRNEDPVCPYCKAGLGGPYHSCGGCRTRYHADCWVELGGCATLGCSGAPVPVVRSDAVSQAALKAPVRAARHSVSVHLDRRARGHRDRSRRPREHGIEFTCRSCNRTDAVPKLASTGSVRCLSCNTLVDVRTGKPASLGLSWIPPLMILVGGALAAGSGEVARGMFEQRSASVLVWVLLMTGGLLVAAGVVDLFLLVVFRRRLPGFSLRLLGEFGLALDRD
jgi:hypothetical protein